MTVLRSLSRQREDVKLPWSLLFLKVMQNISHQRNTKELPPGYSQTKARPTLITALGRKLWKWNIYA